MLRNLPTELIFKIVEYLDELAPIGFILSLETTYNPFNQMITPCKQHINQIIPGHSPVPKIENPYFIRKIVDTLDKYNHDYCVRCLTVDYISPHESWDPSGYAKGIYCAICFTEIVNASLPMPPFVDHEYLNNINDVIHGTKKFPKHIPYVIKSTPHKYGPSVIIYNYDQFFNERKQIIEDKNDYELMLKGERRTREKVFMKASRLESHFGRWNKNSILHRCQKRERRVLQL
jgi:hypothetical protein